MGEIVLGGVALVPLVVGLVEVAKRAGLRAQHAPLLAIRLGPLISVGYQVANGAALVGLALGLSASGLYSGVKAIAPPVRDEPGSDA